MVTIRAYATAVATITSTARDYVARQVPYVWGGTSPDGVDCSGLVVLCYRGAGLCLPRFTGDQANVSRTLDPAEAAPGDLIFYFGTDAELPADVASHVGIYLGGESMIHAPAPNFPVTLSRLRGYWDQTQHRYARPEVLQALLADDDLSPVSARLQPGDVAVVTAEEGVNLRAGSSVSRPVLRTLPVGAGILILAGPVGDGEHTWYRVVTVGTDGAPLAGWCVDELRRLPTG